MMRSLLLVGLGGALGSTLRYLCQKGVYQLYPHPFPWGTFLVNVSGCFLIGLFYALSEKSLLFTPDWRLFLTTGFCGGFTTFSTFSYENLVLLRSGDIRYFLVYTLGSLTAGLVAVIAGVALVKIR
ncbi:MAG TPA: fluoride efflux transporter CrcB [Chitinophagaceae bacterium]|nr:fluoride efflux transporter CrcB [Chitinophagaceae bacterium]